MNISRFVFLVVFMLAFITSRVTAQEISGEWQGNYTKSILGLNPKKLIVILKLYNDSMITGTSFLQYKNNRQEHYRISGLYSKTDSTIYFKEDSIFSVNLPSIADACPGNYRMKLRVTDSSLRFEGKWKDNDRSFLHCPSSGVYLEKLFPVELTRITPSTTANDFADSVDQRKKLQRKADVQSAIALSEEEKDSVTISIYDNGDIDNDRVSLYFGDQQLINNAIISELPINLSISFDKNAVSGTLTLIAESVGAIPPCTAVMIITTKKNKYQLHLSSSFETNGIVQFVLYK